jgi:hypothetical protein
MKNHQTDAKRQQAVKLPAQHDLLTDAFESALPRGWRSVIEKISKCLASAEKRVTDNFRVPPNGG